MNDSNFSSLIYRIIGKPERWHDEYIVEMMQRYLDEAEAVDDPTNRTELAAGDQLLSQLQQGNTALNAFNTLLNKSRFQLIILDDKLSLVYHNQSAAQLFEHLKSENNEREVQSALAAQIRSSPQAASMNSANVMTALDYFDAHGKQVYLRSIQSPVKEHDWPETFHILMVLDEQQADLSLNAELVQKYGFTRKEQRVLQSLIHGISIREIADELFVSTNTIKSHLRSIYQKTNCSSQAAVMSLILTHEAQVLDSYFDSDITTASPVANSKYDRELQLSNGQIIAYCDYGPPAGRPMIVFHSGFGSRLAIPNNHEPVLEEANRRLIVIDRPGLGKSPFVENHPADWNQQLQEFIDLLGIEDYELLGSIIACQMAMSFAAQADQRLTRVVLTSPVFLNEEAHCEYLTEILAPAARYVRLSARFAREIYQLWLKSVTLNLDKHYQSMLAESVGSAERTQFEREGTIQRLTDVFKEGARQGLHGILNEMVFCMTPLHLDIETFTTPLEVWYGTEDKRITRQGVESIFGQFPNSKLHFREGYSEHIYYALFAEIIA